MAGLSGLEFLGTAIISFYTINLFVNRISGNNKEVWDTYNKAFLSHWSVDLKLSSISKIFVFK